MTALTRTIAEQLITEQGADVVIPDKYTSIESVAFYNMKITSVTMPNSIISIGKSAFSYNKLSSIVIPDSVTAIGWGAFLGNELASAVISKRATIIEDNAFNTNNLSNIVIPDSVISIGNFAFHDNPLRTVSISADAAFQTSIFPQGVTVSYRSTEVVDNIINSVVGKGKLRGTESGDQFTFNQLDLFNRENADRIIGFNSSHGDTIGVSATAFPSLQGIETISFASANTKEDLKLLRRKDYNFIYFEGDKNGLLFLNGNGMEKGWGEPDEGGLVAILKGKPELSASDFSLLA